MSTFEYTSAFAIEGTMQQVGTLKRGHINETFLSIWKQSGGLVRYIHQRINHHVFKDVPLLMKNMQVVTDHVRQCIARSSEVPGETTLSIIPTKAGELYFQDSQGAYWRTFEFIEGTSCIDFCTSAQQGYAAGVAFGRFERYLSTLDACFLRESIPRFQDSLFRFEQLKTATKENFAGRLAEVSPELDFALGNEHLAHTFDQAQRAGAVPVRATHADPKVNNILFSDSSGEGICIVDLDTCMPGTVLYDFGDLCRTTIVPAAEDEQDFSKVAVDLHLFEAVTRGFLSQFGMELTSGERELLHISPQLLALTIGVRFLADHLNGDSYFRIHRPGHNLDRARTQFQVVRTMQRYSAEMARIVEQCLPRR
ncbi:MAG: aminoglycoside phosphotransferase family protein [Proteobacteria bacterium]|nr:aminoglycoside phosphotransferase family protein [Pseudomonadota bacterium]